MLACVSGVCVFSSGHLDVFTEVFDGLRPCITEMEVDPVEQQLLGRQRHQMFQFFSIRQQPIETCSREHRQICEFSVIMVWYNCSISNFKYTREGKH